MSLPKINVPEHVHESADREHSTALHVPDVLRSPSVSSASSGISDTLITRLSRHCLGDYDGAPLSKFCMNERTGNIHSFDRHNPLDTSECREVPDAFSTIVDVNQNIEEPIIFDNFSIHDERDDYFSLQKSDDIVSRILTIPAYEYQPEAKLAIVLDIFSASDHPSQLSCLDIKSLNENGLLLLPTIHINGSSRSGFSLADMRMLLTLPKGRLDQIETLYVQLCVERTHVEIERIEGSFSRAIEEIRFSLKNIRTFFVTMRSHPFQMKRDDLSRVSHRFEFDLSHCNNRISTILSVLNVLPMPAGSHGVLLTCLDRITDKSFEGVLKNALVNVSRDVLTSRFKGILSHPNIHLSFEGSRKELTAEEMQELVGLTSVEDNPQPMDLSHFPSLSFLVGNGHILASNVSPVDTLMSLEWTLSPSPDAHHIFKIHLPNLQRLILNDGGCAFRGRIPIDRYPRLLELQLENFNDKAVFDFGSRAVSLYQLTLIKVSCSFIGTERLSTANLRLDDHVSPELLAQLRQWTASVEMSSRSLKHCDYFDDMCFSGNIRNLVLRNDSRRVSFAKFKDLSKISLLVSLSVDHITIHLSPNMFPLLKTLMVTDGYIGFFNDSDSREGNLKYTELQSLCIDSAIVCSAPESVAEEKLNRRGVNRKCYHLHAPKLKILSLKLIENSGWLLVSSEFCPLLEEIEWVYNDLTSRDLPFDNNVPESLNFIHLQSLSVGASVFDPRGDDKPYLEVLFPLQRVSILRMWGHLIVPNFHEMQLSCRYAHLSGNLVHKNLQEQINEVIHAVSDENCQTLSEEAIEKIDKAVMNMLVRILPNVDILIFDGNWVPFRNKRQLESLEEKE